MEGLGGGIKGLEPIEAAVVGLAAFQPGDWAEERMKLLLLQQGRAFSLWKNKDKSGSAREQREAGHRGEKSRDV